MRQEQAQSQPGGFQKPAANSGSIKKLDISKFKSGGSDSLSAPTPVQTPASSSVPAISQNNDDNAFDDEDFGDFEDAAPTAVAVTTNYEPTVASGGISQSQKDEVEEDFGEFDDFTSAVPSDAADDDSIAAKAEDSSGAKGKGLEDKEEFEDFDDFTGANPTDSEVVVDDEGAGRDATTNVDEEVELKQEENVDLKEDTQDDGDFA